MVLMRDAVTCHFLLSTTKPAYLVVALNQDWLYTIIFVFFLSLQPWVDLYWEHKISPRIEAPCEVTPVVHPSIVHPWVTNQPYIRWNFIFHTYSMAAWFKTHLCLQPHPLVDKRCNFVEPLNRVGYRNSLKVAHVARKARRRQRSTD